MKITIVVLFGICATSFCKSITLPSNIDLTFEDTTSTATNDTVRAVSHSKRTEVSVDLSKSKVNESEIFENGQTVKTDHERSFIYIKNVKSKLPWYKSHASLFQDDFGKATDLSEDDTYDRIPNFKVNPKPGTGRYFDHNFAYHYVQAHKNYTQNRYPDNSVSLDVNGRNEQKINDYSQAAFRDRLIHKTPDWSINWDWQHQFNLKAPSKTSYYYSEALKVPVESRTENNFENHRAHLTKFGNQPDDDLSPDPTAKSKDLQQDNRYNKHNNVHNYKEQINIDNHIAINDNTFNCYNRECRMKEMTYRLNMNNGIRFGSQCMCPNSPSFSIALQAQDYQTWKKSQAENDKAFIRSVKAKEMEPYAALIKETKKLTRIVDRMKI